MGGGEEANQRSPVRSAVLYKVTKSRGGGGIVAVATASMLCYSSRGGGGQVQVKQAATVHRHLLMQCCA